VRSGELLTSRLAINDRTRGIEYSWWPKAAVEILGTQQKWTPLGIPTQKCGINVAAEVPLDKSDQR
jgi:hypothetical protein